MLLKFRYSFQFFDGFYFVYSLKFDTKNQTMFELKLQFSRFRASPVCRPSHIGKQLDKAMIKLKVIVFLNRNHCKKTQHRCV